MNKYILEITVLISGAIVMVFELAGSRVLAPYLGTSSYVWTAIIGVILGSLSVGYWLGGKLADKNPNLKKLSYFIFFIGVSIGICGLFKDPLLTVISPLINYSLPLSAIIFSLILFAPASVLSGIISPYAVKLKMVSMQSSGQTVGNLYAISTIGSITGTFMAGFYLIPTFGTSKIIFGAAGLMIMLSLLIYSSKPAIKINALACVLFLLLTNTVLTKPYVRADYIDIDTKYNRLWIHQLIDKDTGKPALALQTDPAGAQSLSFIDSDEIASKYVKYYRLIEHFKPDFKKSLMIGGAAYSFPSYYLSHYPDSLIDVVEIDPGMTEVAKKYFKLDADNERLKIFHEDARVFINNSEEKYDTVLLDAFGSNSSIPYQLTTVETVKLVKEMLNDDGLAIINIISAIEGDKGKFFRAELATYKQIFPQVYVFPVHHTDKSTITQNLIVVALKSKQTASFKSPNVQLQNMLDRLWKTNVSDDMPILTDDYAPVEHYREEET